ncbi:MAG TPA: DUF47 family protein [Gemmatimonadaceae bacterium]|jgi:predicted phosphate transport protein (TIGR00153 family)|nr:DUF47 family protein [Gemmatimonadaceae bacterium]
MLERLLRRDEGFFDSFSQIAKRLTASARLLRELFADPARLAEYAASIKDLEHEADEITRDIISRIDKTFVTPLDREDIHLLASQLDNVVDLVDGTARRAAMFHIDEVRDPALRLADVLVRASDSIQTSVANMRKSRVVTTHAHQLKLLEEEGDAIYHEAVGALFAGQPDPLDVIKWKELYDTLERAIDECEDVANVLESISIKHA